VAMVAFVAVPETAAQGVDPIASAQTLIRVFFPELSHGNYSMLVYWTDPFDRQWSEREEL